MLVRLTVLLVALLVAAPASAADVIYPLGLRVGLAPPPGALPSKVVSGFVDQDKKVAILIAEFPAAAYAELEKGLTADAQKRPGFTKESQQSLTFADGKGVLVIGQQEPPGPAVRRWILVAAIGDVAALVSVEVLKEAVEASTDATIRAALDSLTVRASIPSEELLSMLPYNLKDLAGFRLVQASATGGALLTDGPKNALEVAEQPIVMITIIPKVPDPTTDRGSFARMVISGTPGVKDMRIQRMEPLRITGQQGYEMILDAKDAKGETDVSVVQWLRFGAGSSLRVLAMTRKDGWDKMFPRFRALRDGIEAK